MKRVSTLKNWQIQDRGTYYGLVGEAYNDDRWLDGEVIHTSMLERIDFLKREAETHNTIYKLR